MHWCNVLIHVLPTVYVHLINRVYVNTHQNGHFDIILWVFLRSRDAKEYSSAERRAFCVCVCAQKTGQDWVLSSRIHPYVCSSLTLLYAPCTKCILAYVLPVHLVASNLLCIYCPSLTFSSRIYSLTKMSIDLRHNFCHSKRVFIRYRLVVVSKINVVDKFWLRLFTLLTLVLGIICVIFVFCVLRSYIVLVW